MGRRALGAAQRPRAPTPWSSGPTGRRVLREALWLALTERSIPSQLRYQDRNSMAYSLEERVPFLTPRLAEFVLALPEEYLLGPDGSSKAVFRAAMRGIVPDEILDRADKVGFSVPIQAWLPELSSLPQLLEIAARLPPVVPTEALGIVERLRHTRSIGAGAALRAWWLAGLAAWSEQCGVRFD